MKRALLLAALLPACAPPKPRCFVAEEQSAGWKRVALPPEAPSLAAPVELDQFRAGEDALVWDDDERGTVAVAEPRLGVVELRFTPLSPAARVLEVEFTRGLDGARVDAASEEYGARRMLSWDRRVDDRRLRVEWPVGADALVVTVHRHLRPMPVVARWRTGGYRPLSVEPNLARGFREPGALYFRHPGGRAVELCAAPGRVLEARRSSLSGEPQPSALAHAPAGWLASFRRATRGR